MMWLDYEFPLRPDFRVPLSLPTDLTPDEAERLARFIRTLVAVDEATIPPLYAAASSSTSASEGE